MVSLPRRILLIGKDARTDALASACLASPQSAELFGFAEMVLPGLKRKCQRVFTGSLTDRQKLAEIVDEVQPDLAIVGPEEPLEAGFVDELESHGVPTFGPPKDLAVIESSKSWTRGLLERHDIPGNPDYRVFTASAGLEDYMEALASFVIKPDGLTAGKGVKVFGEHLHSLEEALAYAGELLANDGRVQIEERLEGEEFSLQTITDGETKIHCPAVQDHKRAFDKDRGPNTGGMGSYSCPDFSLPFLEPADLRQAQEINSRVIEALGREFNRPYRGVLYGGFMATQSGVGLIEYNARFGDPEAMNVLPLLDADFIELCEAAAKGRLGDVDYSFRAKATVCKYLVPKDYPGGKAKNETFDVPEQYQDRDDLKWFWAACRQEGDDVYLTSSRSGGLVGIGDSLAEAERIAEEAAEAITAANQGRVRHRSDIGSPALVEARINHMRELRTRALAA